MKVNGVDGVSSSTVLPRSGMQFKSKTSIITRQTGVCKIYTWGSDLRTCRMSYMRLCKYVFTSEHYPLLTLGAHARGFRCLVCVCVSVCLSVCYRSSCFSVHLYLQPTILRGLSLDKCVNFRKALPFQSYGVKKPICK